MNNFDHYHNPLHNDHPIQTSGTFMTGPQFGAAVDAIVASGGITPNVGAGAKQLFTPFATAGGINTSISYNSPQDWFQFEAFGAAHTDTLLDTLNTGQSGPYTNLNSYEFGVALLGANQSSVVAADAYVNDLNNQVGWPPRGVSATNFGGDVGTGGYGPALRWSNVST